MLGKTLEYHINRLIRPVGDAVGCGLEKLSLVPIEPGIIYPLGPVLTGAKKKQKTNERTNTNRLSFFAKKQQVES